MRTSAPVDRLRPGDLAALAQETGPLPSNVGALCVLGPGTTARTVQALIAQRAGRIPRLGQRLCTPPPGLGRPYWVDDPAIDLRGQVEVLGCPEPGDDEALLAVALDVVMRPLPRSQPLWRAVVVTGLADGRLGLVLALHHVLADGIGGLAVLARLVDGAPTSEAVAQRPPPRAAALLVDALAQRMRLLRRLPHAIGRLPSALTEIRPGRRRSPDGAVRSERGAPRCSLNAPSGHRRRMAVVDVPLAPLRTAGRRHQATVNDILLVTVAGAMDAVLRSRGEHLDALVVSVPVSARVTTTTGDLGNAVGVMPVRVPLDGAVADRLTRVGVLTRARKTQARGTSAALVGPLFRLLAALHLIGWFFDRQRLVNTFLTNLPGPLRAPTIGGAEVLRLVPVTITAGNVGVAFAALSCGGTLTVSVLVDPDLVPELDALAAAIADGLSTIAAG